MNYMDIPRVREYDSGQIRVVAKNTEGEAEASTVLNVLPKEDWRSQLRQAPKGELEIELDRKRKIELKNVEFKRPFEIPKAADYELKQIERGKVYWLYKHWGSFFFSLNLLCSHQIFMDQNFSTYYVIMYIYKYITKEYKDNVNML